MRIVFEVTGLSCDLALHPISAQTAEVLRNKSSDEYTENCLSWWRRGATRTFGMRINDQTHVLLTADGKPVNFDPTLLFRDVYTLRSRMYLDSKARYLAVFGYDNETCTFRWVWDNVEGFMPEKFQFVMRDWDNVLKVVNYRVLDNVFYDNRHADDEQWLNPSGFTLREPSVIDLKDVRAELEEEKARGRHVPAGR